MPDTPVSGGPNARTRAREGALVAVTRFVRTLSAAAVAVLRASLADRASRKRPAPERPVGSRMQKPARRSAG
jgi:hypothetical protein